MSDGSGIPPLAPELAHALGLLKASHEMYHDILGAVQDNVAATGEPDLPALVIRFNRALTDFAPRDRAIRRLLDRFEAGKRAPASSAIFDSASD